MIIIMIIIIIIKQKALAFCFVTAVLTYISTDKSSQLLTSPNLEDEGKCVISLMKGKLKIKKAK